MSDEEERSLPLGVVLIGVMLLVAAFFWCCAASAYATDVEGRSIGNVRGPRQFGAAALAFFLLNGVTQLANLLGVIAFTFQQQWWVLIGFVIVEAVVILGFLGIKVVERNLDGPKRKKRKKRT